jgi:hypothetical protein
MDNNELIQRLRKMENKIEFIYNAIVPLAKGAKPSEYMTEAEAIEKTGLKKRALFNLRNKLIIEWRCSSTGRGILYKRIDIENYRTGVTQVAKAYATQKQA